MAEISSPRLDFSTSRRPPGRRDDGTRSRASDLMVLRAPRGRLGRSSGTGHHQTAFGHELGDGRSLARAALRHREPSSAEAATRRVVATPPSATGPTGPTASPRPGSPAPSCAASSALTLGPSATPPPAPSSPPPTSLPGAPRRRPQLGLPHCWLRATPPCLPPPSSAWADEARPSSTGCCASSSSATTPSASTPLPGHRSPPPRGRDRRLAGYAGSRRPTGRQRRRAPGPARRVPAPSSSSSSSSTPAPRLVAALAPRRDHGQGGRAPLARARQRDLEIRNRPATTSLQGHVLDDGGPAISGGPHFSRPPTSTSGGSCETASPPTCSSTAGRTRSAPSPPPHDGIDLDASVLVGGPSSPPTTPRFVAAVAVGHRSCATGPPSTATAPTTACPAPRAASTSVTSWLVEALHLIGRHDDAGAVRRPGWSDRPHGLLSEEYDPAQGSLLGKTTRRRTHRADLATPSPCPGLMRAPRA